MKYLVQLILGVSVVGLGASLVGLVLGYSGQQPLPSSVFYVIIGPMLVVMLALVLVQLYGFSELPRRQWAKLMYAGCPRWMRVLVYCLMAFGVANAFGYIAFEQLGLAGVPSDEAPAIALAGFGIALFSAAFGQCYSFPRVRERIRRSKCDNGHAVPLGAKYCPECGLGVDQGS